MQGNSFPQCSHEGLMGALVQIHRQLAMEEWMVETENRIIRIINHSQLHTNNVSTNLDIFLILKRITNLKSPPRKLERIKQS